MQTTDKVLMVRPVRFAFNEETAGNNVFQHKTEGEDAAQHVQNMALVEFNGYVKMLEDAGVSVTVLDDTPSPFTPDSIFPNNCFSTHCTKASRGSSDSSASGDSASGASGDDDFRTLVIYPMFAQNRREERKKLIHVLSGMKFNKVVDLSGFEKENKFLEGTGAMVLDREARIAFCCRSPRANEEVLEKFSEKLDYDYFMFDATDEDGTPIYHTNVMMSIGTRFAIVCLDSIKDISERERIIELLEENGKEVVDISFEQLSNFTGNALEIRGTSDGKNGSPNKKLLVMSATAKASLTEAQKNLLEKDVTILAPDIHTIETAGGGSARCMLAELF